MAGLLLLVLFSSGSWAQSSRPDSECSLSEEHKADVVFLLNGFNNISADDFSAVRDFLRTVVPMVGPVGPDLVRVALVKSGRDPETEFDLDSFDDVSSVVEAVSRMSQSPPLPGGNSVEDALMFTLENVFRPGRGNRENAPDVLIFITDRNSSGVDTNTLTGASLLLKVFVVGVKVKFPNQSDETIGKVLDSPKFFSVEDYQSISNISKELTQSLCGWLKEKLGRRPALRITDVQPRRARVSWHSDNPQVPLFILTVMMADDPRRDVQMIIVPGHKRSAEISHLRPNTTYRITVAAVVITGGGSVPEIVDLTTPPDSVRMSGPSRCSGSVELMDRSWSGVCGTDFGLTEAAVVCGELDCGAVSEIHQGAPSSAVNRSFHCDGAETSLKECETSETNCSTAANISCTDVVLRFIGFSCAGLLQLRHRDEWRFVVSSVEPDLELGSVLCEQMGCGSALSVRNGRVSESVWKSPVWSLEPECVKQRSGLTGCLDLDWNKTKPLDLICLGEFPVLRASVSSEFLTVSWRQRLLMKLGESFSVSCSLDEPFLPGQLHLLSPSGNYTLPPVNHSAHFLFQAFSTADIGNYTCLYCFNYKFNEECTKSTSLYVSNGAPDSLLLIRAAIFVLILLLWTSALCLYYKGCGRQKGEVGGARRRRPSDENNAVQMVVL